MCFPQKRSTSTQIKGWQGQLEEEASAHLGLDAAPTHLLPPPKIIMEMGSQRVSPTLQK